MYKNTAVICETNPFHNGHAHVFRAAGEDSGIITAVMSGNFVQRGIPAVWDKYTRASLILKNGADIVVELPYPWSVGSVESFSLGGVSIASALGCDRLLFGSESGNTEMLTEAAKWLEREEETLSAYAMQHPDIGAAVIHDKLSAEAGYTLCANDKLGVWYIRQLTRLGYSMVPEAVKRLPSSERVTSASTLREYLMQGRNCASYVPASVSALLNTAKITSPETFYSIAHLYFRLFAPEMPAAESEGGLWERLRKTAFAAQNGTEFIKNAGTKKYTDARIRRAMLLGMTGVYTDILKSVPRYTILLAASEKGRMWLRKHTLSEEFTVLTKPSEGLKMGSAAMEQYVFLQKADNLYGMCMHTSVGGDFFIKKHPIIDLK